MERSNDLQKEKNPDAVALGSKGGTARAKKLTSEQRSAIAKKGADERWKGKANISVEKSEPTMVRFMDRSFQQCELKDIGYGVPFIRYWWGGNGVTVLFPDDVEWCIRLDDSRYIVIGRNGSHHPSELHDFFFEID